MTRKHRRISVVIVSTSLVAALGLATSRPDHALGGYAAVEPQKDEPQQIDVPRLRQTLTQTQENLPGVQNLLQSARANASAGNARFGLTDIAREALRIGLESPEVKKAQSFSASLKASGGEPTNYLQSLSKEQVEQAIRIGLKQLTGLVPPANLADDADMNSGKLNLRASSVPPRKVWPGDPLPSDTVGDWRKARTIMLVNDPSRPDLDQRNQSRRFNDTSKQYDTPTLCGCCWAFGTVGAYEGSYAVRYNKYINIAEQQILNFANPSYSCDGGWWAFDYLVNNAVASESVYEYRGAKGAGDVPTGRFKALEWGYVSAADQIPDKDLLKQALCTYGPLAVAVNATPAFSSYQGGVFAENAPGQVNHAVLLVGWDDTQERGGGGSWVIRNSWGGSWGENGFMYIRYGSNKIGFGAAWVIPAEAQ